MNKPFLSICIPTLNREKAIKRLIDSIIFQEGFTSEVEIVIDDGPSKDNTEALVKEYQKKYPNIRYFRNPEAIGMLPAILEVISLSNGTYTRLFGSDDFMYKDSLSITIAALKKHLPKIVLSSRYVVSDITEANKINSTKKELNYELLGGFTGFGNYIGKTENIEYYTKLNYFSFMSVFCFDTEYYKEKFEYTKKNVCNLEDLNKHYFNYILILYSQLSSNDIVCLVENPSLVFSPLSNSLSRRPNKKIATDSKMMMEYFKKTYTLSKKCKKLLNKIAFGWRVGMVIVAPIRRIPFLSKILDYLFKRKTGEIILSKLSSLFSR